MKEKLKKVIDHLDKVKCIDEEDIRYFPEKFPFTNEEFKEVFGYLHDRVLHVHDASNYFEEYWALFNLDGKKFVWRLLIGQGSALQLCRTSSFTKEEIKHLKEHKL